MSPDREMPAARHSALKPALAASIQFRTRTPVPSVHRSTCVASVLHSRRGKCTLRAHGSMLTQQIGSWMLDRFTSRCCFSMPGKLIQENACTDRLLFTM